MSSDGNLRKIFRQYLQEAHWQSIETGAVGPGVPDSNFCFPKGKEGWIEFKQTAGWRVTLRPGQVGWLLRRARNGGRVFVAVRQSKNDTLWIAHGRHAATLLDKGLRSDLWLGSWKGGPAEWDWSAVKNILTM